MSNTSDLSARPFMGSPSDVIRIPLVDWGGQTKRCIFEGVFDSLTRDCIGASYLTDYAIVLTQAFFAGRRRFSFYRVEDYGFLLGQRALLMAGNASCADFPHTEMGDVCRREAELTNLYYTFDWPLQQALPETRFLPGLSTSHFALFYRRRLLPMRLELDWQSMRGMAVLALFSLLAALLFRINLPRSTSFLPPRHPVKLLSSQMWLLSLVVLTLLSGTASSILSIFFNQFLQYKLPITSLEELLHYHWLGQVSILTDDTKYIRMLRGTATRLPNGVTFNDSIARHPIVTKLENQQDLLADESRAFVFFTESTYEIYLRTLMCDLESVHLSEFPAMPFGGYVLRERFSRQWEVKSYQAAVFRQGLSRFVERHLRRDCPPPPPPPEKLELEQVKMVFQLLAAALLFAAPLLAVELCLCCLCVRTRIQGAQANFPSVVIG